MLFIFSFAHTSIESSITQKKMPMNKWWVWPHIHMQRDVCVDNFPINSHRKLERTMRKRRKTRKSMECLVLIFFFLFSLSLSLSHYHARSHHNRKLLLRIARSRCVILYSSLALPNSLGTVFEANTTTITTNRWLQ